ncbi:uridine diphosphate-N-acetylglucosamine-binding protein YvcK [Granulicatella sp. zg-ZJ]|uniref:gluconeogenesis factor YvcK family protein n=1 Tax=unclassified Granulicatella TaxID=2630493 RepID=UPI0013BEC09B|nr:MULTISPECIES: YvcK family protein [unclassified Granulicatella]MBS4750214.1 YvcK family protein [Carnobacteriaceae bacterium zg-ZUI78]NEW63348.1 uridine diphosphate-N-acetylglucosamine-binding protein YvcK [Granulicatella sp. zg-ZJ]NEW65690.1 uridine diphosphate-N-acetylglucosamine-binding protein YvcK [Granulicatella sp. zg-84]QMI85670.1 YvcK family protein [Carnobacteriaceae bacterium zg-84]
MRKKKVTIIGGGTGLPVLLKELKQYPIDITAIVTVADDGGSSGIIRDYVNIIPPGDIRNCLVALSTLDDVYLDIFQYRFNSEDKFFAGHAIGNLIIAALSEMRDNIFDAIQELSRMMKIQGQVYAAAKEPLVLHATFMDGTVVSGESAIAKERKRIKHVHVTTKDGSIEDAHASSDVVRAIEEADMLVLGPGSLFTSILPNLMIPNVSEAILKTQAQIVYICNIMTQLGETESFTDADHVRVLHRHLKQMFIDTVLVNTETVPDDYLNQQKGEEYLLQVKHHFDGLRGEGCRVISTNFLEMKENGAFHDGKKVVEELMTLLNSVFEK